jgi:hypothetical protein
MFQKPEIKSDYWIAIRLKKIERELNKFEMSFLR